MAAPAVYIVPPADPLPGDDARVHDNRAASIISGVAGVDFSRHVWTKNTDTDFEMSALDEAKMRSWVWDKILPQVMKTKEFALADTMLNKMKPGALGLKIMDVIHAFKQTERVVSQNSLSPMVMSSALEAVNEICGMREMTSLVPEKHKLYLARFLLRHDDYFATFCCYVGYVFLGKQMMQAGASNTIRKMNQVLIMKNLACAKLRDVLCRAGCSKIRLQFNDAMTDTANNPYVMDWVGGWYKAYRKEIASNNLADLGNVQDAAKRSRIDGDRFLVPSIYRHGGGP